MLQKPLMMSQLLLPAAGMWQIGWQRCGFCQSPLGFVDLNCDWLTEWPTHWCRPPFKWPIPEGLPARLMAMLAPAGIGNLQNGNEPSFLMGPSGSAVWRVSTRTGAVSTFGMAIFLLLATAPLCQPANLDYLALAIGRFPVAIGKLETGKGWTDHFTKSSLPIDRFCA